MRVNVLKGYAFHFLIQINTGEWAGKMGEGGTPQIYHGINPDRFVWCYKEGEE